MIYIDLNSRIVSSQAEACTTRRESDFVEMLICYLKSANAVEEADLTTRAESEVFDEALGSNYAKYISATIKLVADTGVYYVTLRDKQIKRNESFPALSSIELLKFNNRRPTSLFKHHIEGMYVFDLLNTIRDLIINNIGGEE